MKKAAKKNENPPTPPVAPNLDITADTNGETSNTSVELSQVRELATRMVQIVNAKKTLEDRLKELSEEQDRIQGADLPALMDQVGLTKFTLTTGEEIVLKPIVKASLPAESTILKERDPDKRIELRTQFEGGLKYLAQHGAGALVKNYVTAELGKDSIKLAKQAIAALKKLKIPAELSRGVHPQSLTSWVKERLEAGQEVDFDLFRVWTGTRAEIKTEKQPARPRQTVNKA